MGDIRRLERRLTLWALGILGTVFATSVSIGVWLYQQNKEQVQEVKAEVRDLRQLFPAVSGLQASINAQHDQLAGYDAKFDKLLERVGELGGKAAAATPPAKK